MGREQLTGHTEGAGDYLFDMQGDPWELNNLIDAWEAHEHVARLRRQLIESLNRRVAPDTAQHVWKDKKLRRTVVR